MSGTKQLVLVEGGAGLRTQGLTGGENDKIWLDSSAEMR